MIKIITVPHKAQRYNTVGDWFWAEGDDLVVRVSDLGDPRMEMLVAFHELVEAFLCLERDIPEYEITPFDMAFAGEGEPGDAPDCPYRKEHQTAEAVERVLALALHVDWNDYADRIEEVSETWK